MNKSLLWTLGVMLALPIGALAAEEERREVEVTNSGTEATIELRRPANESEKDKVTLRFSTSEGALDLTYETEVDQAKYEKTLKTRLHEIVEYQDENDNSQYDDGEPILSSWLLSSESENQVDSEPNGTVNWKPLTVSDVETGEKSGKKISGRADFVSIGGDDPLPLPPIPPVGDMPERTFGVDLYAFGDRIQYKGTELAPTDIRMDWVVSNYPFVEPTSRLALILDTAAENDLKEQSSEIGGSKREGLVSREILAGQPVNLVLAWESTANVDGQDEPVRTTLLKEESNSKSGSDGVEKEFKRTYALSYDRGEEIEHVSVDGAQYGPLSDEEKNLFEKVGVPGLPVVAALLSVGATLAWIRRRQQRGR